MRTLNLVKEESLDALRGRFYHTGHRRHKRHTVGSNSICSSFQRLALLLLLFGVAPCTGVHGQGLVLDDHSYDQLTRLPNYGGKSGDSLLRETPRVDLKQFCPRPQHQGGIGSCTGWSTGYGAMSMIQAIQNAWGGQTDTITKYALSALYLYNQIKIGSCHSGSYIATAAELAKTEGNVRSVDFDLFKNDCDRLPTVADSISGLRNRLKDYVTLFASEAPAAEKLETVRLSLLQQKPVVIGMLLRRNFEACGTQPPLWQPELGDTTFMGAHAMVVVGYDDGRQAFELLNSWGDDWGNGGFIWVRYEDFTRFCAYAIQLIPRAPLGEREKLISAAFEAREPYYDEADELRFKTTETTKDKDFYFTAGGPQAIGTLSRWQLSSITPDTYLYAFSLDPDYQVTVHWPRDGALDDKFSGVKESAIVTMPEPDLFLPAEFGALRFNKAGTEQLCFLISRAPIGDLNEILDYVASKGGDDLLVSLRDALGGRLRWAREVDYSENSVAFTGRMGEEEVIPLLVRFEITQ